MKLKIESGISELGWNENENENESTTANLLMPHLIINKL